MIKSLLDSSKWLGLLCIMCLVVVAPSAAHADSFRFVVSLGNPPPPPPPPRVEVRWAPPSPQHVWIQGHWGHDNDRDGWIWHPGYYECPPVPWANWHPAHGKVYGNTYFWVKGHWDY